MKQKREEWQLKIAPIAEEYCKQNCKNSNINHASGHLDLCKILKEYKDFIEKK